MRYVDASTFVHTASSTVITNYSANSIYDPDVTGGGHQPIGHDQWAEFYNHYVVIGSKIRVTITGDDSTATIPTFICIILDDTAGSFSSLPNILEQGGARYRLLSGEPQNVRPTSVTSVFSAKRFFNIKDVSDNVDRIGAPFGVDALDGAYFQVVSGTTTGAAASLTRYYIVEIDYLVLLSEPKTLPAS